MKLADFMLLDEKKKTSAVLHQGVLVGKRRAAGRMVFLFQLDGFYVETWCHERNHQVQEFRMFRNTLLLQPYLEAISIQDLLP